MKEFTPRGELTPNRVSSTLDVRSTMPEPTKDTAPRPQQRAEKRALSPHAENARAQFDQISAATRYLQNNPEFRDALQQAINEDPQGVMKFFADMESKQREASDSADTVLSRMGIRENPQDRETRTQAIARQGSDLGNRFELDTEGSDTPKIPEVNLNRVSDIEFRNIAGTFNNDVLKKRLEKNDRYAHQQLSKVIDDLVKRINEKDFPPTERDIALDRIGELKNIELGMLSTASERERTPQEEGQYHVYKAAEKFDKDYDDVIEAERRGVSTDRMAEVFGGRYTAFRKDRQKLVRDIEKQIDEGPSIEASRFPPMLMEAASRFKETREMLVNEILFKTYADKTQQGHYEINLYASGHLDELLATMARRAKRPEYVQDRKDYEWYQALKTTSRNFWEMNRGLWTGNLEVFSRIAEEMNYDQFQTMQRISGVSETMRLYDEKFMEVMAKHNRMTSDSLEEVKREVREELIKMNEEGLMRSDYYDQREGLPLERRKLESWEVERALNVGFVFFNITFRGPELTSISQLEKGDKRYASFPYENAARMLNIILTAERFDIAEKRGGINFLMRARDNTKEIMAEDGRHQGENRFSHINGVSVDDLEFMANMGISGIFSGWRMSTAAFEGIELNLGGGDVTNLWEFMKKREMTYKGAKVNGLQGYIGKIREDHSLNPAQQGEVIVKALEPLIGKDGALEVGLGMLLRLGQGNQGLGGFLSTEAGFKARQEIWKRVAEKNLLTTANILTNLKEDGGKTESEYSLVNLMVKNRFITRAQVGNKNTESPDYFLNNQEWKTLRSKLQLQQEINVKKQSKLKEDRVFAESRLSSIVFTESEKRLMADITNAGHAISKDLADIVFPYMIFMNDMPFEKFNWAGPGAQFFKRRIGDIGSYNKALGAASGMMDNLAGMKPEDVVTKSLKEIQRGIESPNGADSGWAAVLPFIYAYLEMAQTNPGLDSQLVVKDIKMKANKPTSILQEYGGVHAPSLDENAAMAFVHLLHHEGVIDHHMAEEIRKRRGFTLLDIIIAAFRDYAPVFALSMILDTPKAAVNLK